MPQRSTAPPTNLERGREAFDRQAWADARDHLSAADREASLAPDDLGRLAMAAYLVGDTRRAWSLAQGVSRVGSCRRCRSRRSQRLLGGRRASRAGRDGTGRRLACQGQRLVGEEGGERVESGYLLVAAAVQNLAIGDPHAALERIRTSCRVSARGSPTRTWS